MSQSLFMPFLMTPGTPNQSQPQPKTEGEGGALPTLMPFYNMPPQQQQDQQDQQDQPSIGDANPADEQEPMAFAEGGLVPLAGGGKIAIGPGGGLDDLIPTSIEGRRAAALSDGEFVIPADVVSMMGDGSSNAGARRLYDLVRQVRDAKTGTSRQAGPLPVGEILKRSLS